MKSNDTSSPIDQYFRQHEAEIPVTYDSGHWSQLAALLDDQKKVPTPEPPGQPPMPDQTNGRRVKGWWVSGIWILFLTLASLTIWQTASNGFTNQGSDLFPPKKEAPYQPQDGGVPGLPEKEQDRDVEQKQSLANPSDPQGKVQFEAPQMEPVKPEGAYVQPLDSAKNAVAGTPDSLSALSPIDSIPIPKPIKKKKYLFW